ncbi:hypothetical protein Pse7429DRAFT_1836 [Pseudanabaena biceps PCC 7429]|uniref:Uncharacterized protein n=1 Tax=Pseudanabaena biceps PCC 7429 TaxID=927668 RepID=L8N1Q7_9CYAN|nr:hypothetical protein Pse7429DRAFT_1836 [Pseudanabaena biceps PCC 7429]
MVWGTSLPLISPKEGWGEIFVCFFVRTLFAFCSHEERHIYRYIAVTKYRHKTQELMRGAPHINSWVLISPKSSDCSYSVSRQDPESVAHAARALQILDLYI